MVYVFSFLLLLIAVIICSLFAPKYLKWGQHYLLSPCCKARIKTDEKPYGAWNECVNCKKFVSENQYLQTEIVGTS